MQRDVTEETLTFKSCIYIIIILNIYKGKEREKRNETKHKKKKKNVKKF